MYPDGGRKSARMGMRNKLYILHGLTNIKIGVARRNPVVLPIYSNIELITNLEAPTNLNPAFL